VTKISASVIVRGDAARTRQALLTHLGSLPKTKGGERLLRLRAMGPKPGVGKEQSDRSFAWHDAHVTFKNAFDELRLEYRVQVNWVPIGTRALPSFNGLFHLQRVKEPGRCRLVIAGEYEPPLSIVGKAFDAIAGKRIAQDTLRRLLGEIRGAIEAANAD